MDIRQFKTDEKLEEEGTWFDLSDESSLKLARWGNKNAEGMLRKLQRPYRRMMAFRDLPDDLTSEMMVKVMAKHIIKDWKGFTDNGSDFLCNEENATRLLNESKDFRDLVTSLSNDASGFFSEKNL